MARILENGQGRRTILLSADDVISVVKEYQNTYFKTYSYEQTRKHLKLKHICIPEEII